MSRDTEVMRAVLAGTRPSDEQYQDYYRVFHGEMEAATEESVRDFRDDAGRNSYQRVADALDAPALETVLDVGCGNGPLLAEVVARNPAIRVSGIDLSPEEIARARARVPDANIDRLAVGDAANMPFADAAFDAVTSHMVLMLLPQLDPVLAEIRRVLRPAGKLAFLVPRRSDSETRVTELLRAVPQWIRECHPAYTPVDPGDPRAWDAARLVEAIREAGFTRVDLDDFVVTHPADAQWVWKKLMRRYYIGSLPQQTQEHVRSRVLDWLGMGHLDYSESLRIVSAT